MAGKLQFCLIHRNKSDFIIPNENGDNNERTRCLKKKWEYSGWEFSGGIYQVGNKIDGNFPGKVFLIPCNTSKRPEAAKILF